MIYLIDEKDGASAIEISQRFQINTSRVAALLKTLSKKGYIERKSDPKDKRKIQVYITDKGKQYGQQRREDILNHIDQMLEMLGEEDAKEHLRIMKRIAYIYQSSSKDND